MITLETNGLNRVAEWGYKEEPSQSKGVKQHVKYNPHRTLKVMMQRRSSTLSQTTERLSSVNIKIKTLSA